jgi:hypothetical protein
MTKKHFEAIATIINQTSRHYYGEAQKGIDLEKIIWGLTIYFKKEFPKFEGKRFIKACHKEYEA